MKANVSISIKYETARKVKEKTDNFSKLVEELLEKWLKERK